MQILESSSNNKYLHLENQKKLFNILNQKRSTKVPDLKNQKIIIALLE